MKTLFETVVGSHAWGMNTPKSDIDLFRVFIVPTRDYLSGNIKTLEGRNLLNSTFDQEENKDKAGHEIGAVIEQLLKGNFNFVLGVCSPVVNEDKYGYLPELRDIVKRNISKNIYHSTSGLAHHNYKKYNIGGDYREVEFDCVKGKSTLRFLPKKILPADEIQKKRNLIVRSLMFGEWILSMGEIRFKKIENQSIEDVNNWMKKLDEAYKNSKLPENLDPQEFRDFLYKVRINELEGII